MARRARSCGIVLLALALLVCKIGLDRSFVQPQRATTRQGQQVQTRSVVARNLFGGNPLAALGGEVVIKEDYTLAAVFLSLGALLCVLVPYLGLGLGAIILLLGVLFYVQTGRVRFCFDGDAMEVKTIDGEQLEKTGENIVVGGENRWSYSSFVNWEFFPKGWVEQGLPPILVYFKETQTPEESWNQGPGAQANSPEAVAKGAIPGQVHFFPCVCDAQQIKAEFEKRGCKKIVTAEA
mmetsp:Transcript_46110/g.84485  ORF Transcript_46110/g.84485 Transcript_46110/m.84485 type:complete len:237 (+) Transcript_46110:47-757(+)